MLTLLLLIINLNYIDMGNLMIYKEDIVKEICNALNIKVKDETNVRVHVNPNTNTLKIVSTNHILYNDYIKPEVIKILNKRILELI